MRALLQNADSTMTAAIIAGSLAGGGVVLAIIIIFLVLVCRRYFKKDPVVEELGNVHARTQARVNTLSTISGSLNDTDTRKRQDSVTSNGSLGAQPVATYYDKKPPLTNQQPHRSSGRKRKKEADRLPGGAPVALQHSISFENIYPRESKLPAKGSILRNSQRKKKRLGDSSGDSSLRDSSLSDTSNSSFEQQTSAVSLNPEGRERRPRHHHAQNSYSNLPANQANNSYMASPNTSQEAAFHNPAYDWTPTSDNSVFDYSSQIDTSHDSETSNKKVSFAPGVPRENAKGPPKRLPKVVMTPEMMGLTKPPKYRQKHVKQPAEQNHKNLPKNSPKVSKKGEKGSESPRVPSSPSQRHRHRTQAHGGGHVNPAFSRDPRNRPPSLRKKRKHPRQSVPPGDSNQNYAVSPDTQITAGNVLMNGHRQSQIDSTSTVDTSYAADTSTNMSMDVSQQYSPQQQQVPHTQQPVQQQVQQPVQQYAQQQQAAQPQAQPRVPPQAQQYRPSVAQPPVQTQVQQHPMPAVNPEQAPHNESYETEV